VKDFNQFANFKKIETFEKLEIRNMYFSNKNSNFANSEKSFSKTPSLKDNLTRILEEKHKKFIENIKGFFKKFKKTLLFFRKT